jgi:nucleotide-binding universal stress UspA family protein
MYKDLLVALTDTPGDDAALDVAAELGERLQAHVAALAPVSLFTPIGFEWGAIPDDLVARLHQAERDRGEALAARVRGRRTGGLAAPLEVRVADSQFLTRSRIATVHARHADLTLVATGGDEANQGMVEAMFLDLLMESGGPVVAVPPAFRATGAPRHAVVAWRPTREASRALRDAIPLLRGITRIDVLVIDPKVDDTRYGPQPGADISAHLARHGLAVQLVAEPNRGEPDHLAVLRHVVESGADLVVAGGYGHSRVREFWLGGVTRTLLEQSPVPVLFAH